MYRQKGILFFSAFLTMEWKSVYFSLGILLARHYFKRKKCRSSQKVTVEWSSPKYTFQRDKNLLCHRKRDNPIKEYRLIWPLSKCTLDQEFKQPHIQQREIDSCFQKWEVAAAAAAAKSLQSCLILCDPIDGSAPGSPVPGILQARTLEWVAISFSNAWKWKVKVNSLSCVRLLATPWTAAHQAPPSMGFSRQEYWSGVPLPSPKWEVKLA